MTRLTDYGIVLLTYFARDPQFTLHNARDVAASARLPLPTVNKILKALTKKGLLVSHRGVKGGYRPDVKQFVIVPATSRVPDGLGGLAECTLSFRQCVQSPAARPRKLARSATSSARLWRA
jgi:hypothetical protein